MMYESEILQAIRDAMEASGPDEGAMTTGEIAAALGISRHRVLNIIRDQVAAGTIEVRVIVRKNIIGRMSPVPAWVVVE